MNQEKSPEESSSAGAINLCTREPAPREREMAALPTKAGECQGELGGKSDLKVCGGGRFLALAQWHYLRLHGSHVSLAC